MTDEPKPPTTIRDVFERRGADMTPLPPDAEPYTQEAVVFIPRSISPLLRSLTRGVEPADSLAYQSGVVTFIPPAPNGEEIRHLPPEPNRSDLTDMPPPPPKPTDEP
jgi:hypothetical protein